MATILTVAVHEQGTAAEVMNPGGREVVVTISDGSRTYRTPHRIIVNRDGEPVGEAFGAWPGPAAHEATRDIARVAIKIDRAVREADIAHRSEANDRRAAELDARLNDPTQQPPGHRIEREG